MTSEKKRVNRFLVIVVLNVALFAIWIFVSSVIAPCMQRHVDGLNKFVRFEYGIMPVIFPDRYTSGSQVRKLPLNSSLEVFHSDNHDFYVLWNGASRFSEGVLVDLETSSTYRYTIRSFTPKDDRSTSESL